MGKHRSLRAGNRICRPRPQQRHQHISLDPPLRRNPRSYASPSNPTIAFSSVGGLLTVPHRQDTVMQTTRQTSRARPTLLLTGRETDAGHGVSARRISAWSSWSRKRGLQRPSQLLHLVSLRRPATSGRGEQGARRTTTQGTNSYLRPREASWASRI